MTIQTSTHITNSPIRASNDNNNNNNSSNNSNSLTCRNIVGNILASRRKLAINNPKNSSEKSKQKVASFWGFSSSRKNKSAVLPSPKPAGVESELPKGPFWFENRTQTSIKADRQIKEYFYRCIHNFDYPMRDSYCWDFSQIHQSLFRKRVVNSSSSAISHHKNNKTASSSNASAALECVRKKRKFKLSLLNKNKFRARSKHCLSSTRTSQNMNSMVSERKYNY
jgi:hypothetical protein